MTGWSLPKSATIGGEEYTVNSDFRDVLEILSILTDSEEKEYVRTRVALALFYNDFDAMPDADHAEACAWMADFIDLGEEDDGVRRAKTIDWEQDRMMIAAEVNKVAGVEVRSLEYLHWWTFMSYFHSIGEGQLSFVVGIRDKLSKGKRLEKHEAEFYRNNRARVDIKTRLTCAEEETLNKWLGK